MTTLHRIVLTGGPCGGKTTALARISERLSSLGYRVFLAPEAATLLIGGGASFLRLTPEQLMAVEASLLTLQVALEESFLQLAAAAGQPAVVIFDRGTMDVSAYMPPEMWQGLLDERGYSVVAMRDRRYDAVLHLVTAAEGAAEFYTLSTHVARTESPELARELDRKLREAWVGHPHLRVIDNSTDFAGKIHRVLEAVTRVVGVPSPLEVERKFLVKRVPERMPVRSEEVEIEQTYLRTSDGSEARVRRRGQRGSFTYTHTMKRPAAESGQRVEVERPLTAREFVGLLAQADPVRRTVKKRRTCFLWEGLYYQLDRFLEPRAGMVILEAELDGARKDLKLPPFIGIDREVTAEPAYSNYAIAAP